MLVTKYHIHSLLTLLVLEHLIKFGGILGGEFLEECQHGGWVHPLPLPPTRILCWGGEVWRGTGNEWYASSKYYRTRPVSKSVT